MVRLSELVLTLNNFSFDGEHYQQTNGVAIGTKIGPNYANLFVDFVEKQIFEQYIDPIPDYTFVGTWMTVLAQHHVLVSNWNALLTLLIISIQHSSSHGRSVRPVYNS